MTFWEGFKEWLEAAFALHPVYTILFGTVCFALGFLLG